MSAVVSDVASQFTAQTGNFVVAGFSFGAAIAWMDLVRFIIAQVVSVPKNGGVYYLLTAIFTTLLSIVVFSLCSVFTGLAGTFMLLLLARVVMGMAEGPFLPVCLSIINEQSSPSRRGVNIGLVQTF